MQMSASREYTYSEILSTSQFMKRIMTDYAKTAVVNVYFIGDSVLSYDGKFGEETIFMPLVIVMRFKDGKQEKFPVDHLALKFTNNKNRKPIYDVCKLQIKAEMQEYRGVKYYPATVKEATPSVTQKLLDANKDIPKFDFKLQYNKSKEDNQDYSDDDF